MAKRKSGGMRSSIQQKTQMHDSPMVPNGPTGSPRGYGPVRPITATGPVKAGDKPVPTTA